MNRLMICNGFFFLVSASVVTVMATATRVAAGPIVLTDTRTLDELIALSDEERSKISIAIGRRLGYPLNLVPTAIHSFLPWDDPVTREGFNIEGTGRGYGTYSDESGRHWPREWNDAQRDSGNYLKSLTSREELAVFLKTRGDHLFFTGRLFDPLRCYETTIQLSPRIGSANYQYEQTARLIEKLEAQSRTEQVASEVEAAYRRHERRRRTDPRLIMTGTPKFPTEHPASRRQLGLAAHGHGVLFPISGLHGLRSASPLGSFDRTGSIMPSFQESLEAPILCNEALIRFVKPNIHRLNRGVVPAAPRRRIRNHRARR